MLHGIILKAINRMADEIQIVSREAEEIFEIQTEEMPNQVQKENSNVTVFESIYSNIACNLEDYEKMEIHIVEEQLEQDKVRCMIIQDIIGKRTYFLNEYNEQLVRKLVKKINVINAFQIEVVFKIGLVVLETWKGNDK